MSEHEGHRLRLKKRFIEHGLDDFDDHHALELALYYAIPRQDTKHIAHRLINHFGSLYDVFEASIEELSAIEGMGENSAALLKLMPAMGRKCQISKSRNNCVLNSTKAAGDYLLPYFMFQGYELVYVVCLDVKNRVLGCREIARGSPNMAEISMRKIVELALSKKASGIIIAHNHTSGIAIPSIEDEDTTNKIASALAGIGVKLLDHIIVAGDDFVSMAESGLI
jgi:DNA repair protein RadC